MMYTQVLKNMLDQAEKEVGYKRDVVMEYVPTYVPKRIHFGDVLAHMWLTPRELHKIKVTVFFEKEGQLTHVPIYVQEFRDCLEFEVSEMYVGSEDPMCSVLEQYSEPVLEINLNAPDGWQWKGVGQQCGTHPSMQRLLEESV